MLPKEWVEPLWKWCNQIYQSSAEGHTQLQQSLHRQEEQPESVRATLSDRVQKLEIATRQSCDRLSAEDQEVLTRTKLNMPTLYKFEHENRTSIPHLDEHYNQVLNRVGDHQNDFQRRDLQLVGRVENLENLSKEAIQRTTKLGSWANQWSTATIWRSKSCRCNKVQSSPPVQPLPRL